MLAETKAAFEAAHRQLGDTGKCGRLHGHNWVVKWVVEGEPNDVGYIIDFKELHDSVEALDHAVLLNESDPLVEILNDAKQKVLTFGYNPTCENLARYFADNQILPNMDRVEVTVWENDISFATYEVFGHD